MKKLTTSPFEYFRAKVLRNSIPFVLLLVLLASCSEDIPEQPEPPDDQVEFAVETGNSQVPYITINTKGFEIQNEPKVPAEMRIYMQKNEIQRQTIGIEYRGSTSFRISNKKSFGIETWDEDGNDVDVSFFNFPEEEDWILTGHVVNLDQGYIFDESLMYHYFGYQLYERMGNYASRTQFVELEINGEYQGVYVFMEKLKRDKSRIDLRRLDPTDQDSVNITGGYILKIDKTAGGDLDLVQQPLEYFENNWDDDARYTSTISFRSEYDINGELINFAPFQPPYHPQQYLETYFLYEYPKPEDITDAQKAYIQDYIHQFETALLSDDLTGQSRTYTNFIDMESFVDYFLLNELVRNVDGYRLSTYLTKDREGKLNMGPVWDLNIGYDRGDRVPIDGWVINYNQYVNRDAWMMPFWWPRLLEDPIFRTAVKSRWLSLRSGLFSTITLHDMVDEAANFLIQNDAITRNYDVWGPVDYESSIQSLKTYLDTRASWMDDQINQF